MDSFIRGYENSPIIIVGDSLPNKETTREKIREVLDRRHVIYRSLVMPLKYYINDTLMHEHGGYKLPKENSDDRKNDRYEYTGDIFMYINAVDNSSNKINLDLDSAEGRDKLSKLRNELIDEKGNCRYKIIICLGDFAYFAVRGVLNKFKKDEKRCYPSRKRNDKLYAVSIYTINELGDDFSKEVNGDKEVYILPLLHNSANRKFESTDEFIDASEPGEYHSYLEYAGKKIADLLWKMAQKDNDIKEYLTQEK